MQYPEVADNGGFEVAESRTKQQEDRDRAQTHERTGGMWLAQPLARDWRMLLLR